MRILVVEDEEAAGGQALRRGLMQEGFAVDVADDGETGLILAQGGGYDADRPRHHASRHERVPGLRRPAGSGVWTPILMLTAKDGEYDHAEALDTGADDFLAKPFSFVVLVAHLRALLRAEAAANARPY